MKRKSTLFGIGIVLALAVAAGALVVLVRHEPGFYRHMAVDAGEERRQRSREFTAEFFAFLNGIIDKRQWYGRFTSEQINSYFEEDFARHRPLQLPEEIHEPRVAFDKDKIRLAFRYGSKPWSTVLSIDLRVWLAPKEPNVVALELLGMRAGLLPVSAMSILERVTEAIRQDYKGIEVNWYRLNGNPVALLRFQADKITPTMQLQQLELNPGEIIICGCSVEAIPLRAHLRRGDFKPAAN